MLTIHETIVDCEQTLRLIANQIQEDAPYRTALLRRAVEHIRAALRIPVCEKCGREGTTGGRDDGHMSDLR